MSDGSDNVIEFPDKSSVGTDDRVRALTEILTIASDGIMEVIEQTVIILVKDGFADDPDSAVKLITAHINKTTQGMMEE